MAEGEKDEGEKEFEASEQRRRQAREEGDVPQSKEANGFALFVGIFLSALVLRFSVGNGVFEDFSALLYHSDAFAADIFESGGSRTAGWFSTTIVKFFILLLIIAVCVLLALVVQRSITFSVKKSGLRYQENLTDLEHRETLWAQGAP